MRRMIKQARRDARFWFRLSEAEKEALQKLATERDLTAAQVVRRAIRNVVHEWQERAR
jgi:predicted transcriptional regulator